MYKYLLILLAVFVSQSAMAQNTGDLTSRAYIGIGAADYELVNDLEDTNYIIYGGWSGNYKDKEDVIRFELRYMRGNPNGKVNLGSTGGVLFDVDFEVDVYQLGGFMIWNIINTEGFGLYAELGGSSAKYYQPNTYINGFPSFSERENFFSYGLGMRYNFLDSFSVRIAHTIDHIDALDTEDGLRIIFDKPSYTHIGFDYRF